MIGSQCDKLVETNNCKWLSVGDYHKERPNERFSTSPITDKKRYANRGFQELKFFYWNQSLLDDTQYDNSASLKWEPLVNLGAYSALQYEYLHIISWATFEWLSKNHLYKPNRCKHRCLKEPHQFSPIFNKRLEVGVKWSKKLITVIELLSLQSDQLVIYRLFIWHASSFLFSPFITMLSL